MPRKKRLVAMRASHAAQTLRRLKQLPRDEVSNLDFLLNSELSPLVKCSNHAFVVAMERQMNIWFRHHVVTMEKLCRRQVSEYRNLVRVKNDVRRMYREGVIRRREDEEFHRRLASRREQDEVEFKMMFLAIEDGREKELERMKAQETLRRRLDKSRRIESKDRRYSYSDNFLKVLYASRDLNINPSLPSGEQRQESIIVKGTSDVEGSRPSGTDGEAVEEVSASEIRLDYDGDNGHDLQPETDERDHEARGEASSKVDSLELSENVKVAKSDSKAFSGATGVPDVSIDRNSTVSSSGPGRALETEKRASDIHLAPCIDDTGKLTSNLNKQNIKHCEVSSDKKMLREDETSADVDDHNDSKLRMTLDKLSATYVDTSSKARAAKVSAKVSNNKDPISRPTNDDWECSVRMARLPDFEVAPIKSVTKYRRERTGALVGTTKSVKPSDEQFPMPSKRAVYMQRKALQRLVEQGDFLSAKVDDFITDCETMYRPVSSLAHRPGLAYSRHHYVITGDDNHLQGPTRTYWPTRREHTALNVPKKNPGKTGAISDQSETSRKRSVTMPGADGQQMPSAVQTLHK